MRFAYVWVRVLRKASAWALPRPSAIASAKFAKMTVNQSQSVIWTRKLSGSPSVPVKIRTVVDHRAHFGDKHHRVLHHVDRVEFLERFADRGNDNRGIEDGM